MAKTDIRNFDYTRVGTNDAEMWRAYYNHQFFKLFVQLLKLMRSQLGLNWLVTARLAYYSAWAAADYRIFKHKVVREDRVLRNIQKFYKLISDNNIEPFDYKKAAKYELEWWNIHRKSYQNNRELERSLAEGAAAIYGIQAKNLTMYAHYRAEAMILPRHEGDGQTIPTDWEKVNELLIQAWGELHTAVQKR